MANFYIDFHRYILDGDRSSEVLKIDFEYKQTTLNGNLIEFYHTK